uniref:Putative ATP-dependent endonuclease of the OLD family n=1 Tax=Candidatus Kentrum sp. LPFa TaxID=2126335 RepID=A0A450XDM4_9GAMM|nr:MAG: putative ATP-dependent endonuclease of the OLD family [Candidatus Kentron sp. LPFa]VFK27402.1 MAG: putative ATP-dependent endonuclease of the OLD family [Candidatus Kentron sp. LPFa]
MRLSEIELRNFRGIGSLHLPLDGLAVLIGENNTGKSTVLEAIRLVLTRGFGIRRGGQFTEYDFHLKDAGAAPQTADPISIILHFAEERENEWPDAVIQQMDEVIQFDPKTGFRHIRLQAKGVFNSDSASFETQWAFLDAKGAELPLKNAAQINLITRFVPIFFLSALRDTSREFGQRGQFWSGFLKSIQLPDDEREQLEENLREINETLIGANPGLTEVTKKIADTGQFVPLDSDNPVALETIPTRVFDMIGKIQVHLKSSYGAKLPLQHHGEGTQSLAVLMLFQAFVATNLAEAYAPESTPILALEEPEAHLHPSAIRSLGSFLKDMTGQILVSSHSGDLVSRVPITALRRLYKQDGKTKIGRVERDAFTDRELQAVDYNIRLARGHYLFSRCWLLVEGESEFHLMPLLFEAMGYDQDQVGFSIIEISQVTDKGEPLIKLAKALGIRWFSMADGDEGGNEYIKRAKRHLDEGEDLADYARQLSYADIEHEFWHNGYADFIENMLSPNASKGQIDTQAGDEEKKTKILIKSAIKQAGGKPAFAKALADETARRSPDAIPPSIRAIIKRVVRLAEG